MNAEVLIVDDEEDIRNLIHGILQDEGYTTRQAANSKQTYKQVSEKKPDIVILDIWLNESAHDGLEILDNVKRDNPDLPVIMISGHGTIETAVTAIQKGAYNFIEKPFKTDRLLLMIKRALENANLIKENARLKKGQEKSKTLIGQSSFVKELSSRIETLKNSHEIVSLTGPIGTGKKIVARIIHQQSVRADFQFTQINCSQFSETDLPVLFQEAEKGTIFFHHIDKLSFEDQSKLLVHLNELPKKYNVRVIMSLSNKNVESKIDKKLYDLISPNSIELIALKNRKDDIKFFATYFLKQIATQSGRSQLKLSKKTLAAMAEYDWPYNLWQLRHFIEYLYLHLSANETIEEADLPKALLVSQDNADQEGEGDESQKENFIQIKEILDLPLREAREIFEKQYLEEQVNRFEGNISKTAKFVGMERSALHRKIKMLKSN